MPGDTSSCKKPSGSWHRAAAKARQPSEDFPSQETGETQTHLNFVGSRPILPLVAAGPCDRQRGWRAESPSLGSRWREVAAPQLGGISGAAVGPSTAQHTPEEEKEEEEAAVLLQFAPSGCYCLAEEGLDANSGMSYAWGWALALLGTF